MTKGTPQTYWAALIRFIVEELGLEHRRLRCSMYTKHPRVEIEADGAVLEESS